MGCSENQSLNLRSRHLSGTHQFKGVRQLKRTASSGFVCTLLPLFAGVVYVSVIYIGVAQAATISNQPTRNGATLETINREISKLESDLLMSDERRLTANQQLSKIQRLLKLQKSEISLTQKKIEELEKNLESFGETKRGLEESIAVRKKALRKQLIELSKLADSEAFDVSWFKDLDVFNQKQYFLSKTVAKNLTAVQKLKKESTQALALEMRVIEEKNRMDYYVQELSERVALLSANEKIQREIMSTNKAQRMDVLRKVSSLKETEQELQKRISAVGKKLSVITSPFPERLPRPVEGAILSAFGKSYDPKTNLFTFQKGVTFSARQGQEVKSVAAGNIVFSGPLKNYGLIVIVEHPNQYFSLYGQLSETRVEGKATLYGGEVLGVASSDPVYFEIRNKNIAVNPMQWFGDKKVALWGNR